jgi:hypothetical protein
VRCVRGADKAIRSAVGNLIAGDVAGGFRSVLSTVLLLILPLLIFLGLVLILLLFIFLSLFLILLGLAFIGVGGTVLAVVFAELDALATAPNLNYIDDDDNSILLI